MDGTALQTCLMFIYTYVFLSINYCFVMTFLAFHVNDIRTRTQLISTADSPSSATVRWKSVTASAASVRGVDFFGGTLVPEI